MRARFTGSEIVRSGRVTAYRQPENTALVNAHFASFYLQNREAVTVPADRKWHLCLWKPALPRDLAYWNDYAAFSVNEQSQLIMVDGGSPGSSFEIDIMGWYEVIGNTLPFLSRSHSDPLGLSVVSAALSEKQPVNSDPLSSFLKTATAIARESVSFIDAAAPVIGAVASLI
jgi:hypothetical protein